MRQKWIPEFGFSKRKEQSPPCAEYCFINSSPFCKMSYINSCSSSCHLQLLKMCIFQVWSWFHRGRDAVSWWVFEDGDISWLWPNWPLDGGITHSITVETSWVSSCMRFFEWRERLVHQGARLAEKQLRKCDSYGWRYDVTGAFFFLFLFFFLFKNRY